METHCGGCQEPILEGEPKAELSCHHFYHTQCVLDIVATGFINHCSFCNGVINTNVGMYHNDFDGTYTQIQNLYQTNQEFKKSALALAREQKKTIAKIKEFKKVTLEKKAELDPQIQALRTALAAKKVEVKQSDEYKICLLAMRKYRKLEREIAQKYNINEFYLCRALREERGFRSIQSLGRLYYSTTRFLRRHFTFS